MNRRMQKAESARKFYAALVRFHIGRTLDPLRQMIAGARQHAIALEAAAAEEHVGFGLDTAWLDEMADAGQAFEHMADAARQAGQSILDFGKAMEAVPPMPAGWPLDPWPCGQCSIVTEDQPRGFGRYWRVIKHVQTCAACRALGAPETVPYR